MKLAVIIPTYNSLATLKVLLAQVFKYTTGDFKVYVIEDGQRRETVDWLSRVIWRRVYPLNVIFHAQNRGVAPSWNDGLREAMEDGCTHFAILNDDIELPKNWWTKCQKMFKDDVHLLSLDAPCPIPVITGWFFILDKTCIEQVGYFDEQFAPFTSEDTDYAYRFQARLLKYAKIKLKVKHKGSHTLKQLANLEEVRQENWHKLRQKYPHIRMQAQ